MQIYISGFVLGFSLILAIGAQNAFVLRQGIRREHVLLVVLTCAISDAILIATGVLGLGWLSQVMPWLSPVLRYGGVMFLGLYGAQSFWSAFRSSDALSATDAQGTTWQRAFLTCLALTWLNPHVYLDTVVLVGSLAAQYGAGRNVFGAGAISASLVFFFLLGFGARFLAPIFANPKAWRVLDFAVGGVMWLIAWGLLVS